VGEGYREREMASGLENGGNGPGRREEERISGKENALEESGKMTAKVYAMDEHRVFNKRQAVMADDKNVKLTAAL